MVTACLISTIAMIRAATEGRVMNEIEQYLVDAFQHARRCDVRVVTTGDAVEGPSWALRIRLRPIEQRR